MTPQPNNPDNPFQKALANYHKPTEKERWQKQAANNVAPHLPQAQPEHQESRETATEYCARCDSYKRKDGTIVEYIDRPGCGDNHDFVKRSTPPPQPVKPKCITCGREGHGACGGLGPVPKQSNPKPLSTTPIESDPVNAWMLANGWDWIPIKSNGAGGYWNKENPDNTHMSLTSLTAAEMYRMSEVRVAEALKRTFWITDGPKEDRMTRKLKGPFTSVGDASLARAILEDQPGDRTYWIQQLAATNPRKEIEG